MFFNKKDDKFYDEKISQAQGTTFTYSHGITSDYIKIDKNKYLNVLKIANNNNLKIDSYGGYTSNNLSFVKKTYDKYENINIFEKNVETYINKKLNYIGIDSNENLLFLLSATASNQHDLALKAKNWLDNINDKKQESIDLYLSSNNSETKDLDFYHFISQPNIYNLSSLFDAGYTFTTNNQQFTYSPLVIEIERGGLTGFTGNCSVGLTNSGFELTTQQISNTNTFSPNNTENIYISTDFGQIPPQSVFNIIGDILEDNQIQESDVNDFLFSGYTTSPFPIITLKNQINGVIPVFNQETLDQTMNAIYQHAGITFTNPYTLDDVKDYFKKDGRRGSPYQRHLEKLIKEICGAADGNIPDEEFHPNYGPTGIMGEEFGDLNGDGIIDDNEVFNDRYPWIVDIFFGIGDNDASLERLRSIFWNTLSSCCEFKDQEDVDWWSENNKCGIISYSECCQRKLSVKIEVFKDDELLRTINRDFQTILPNGWTDPNPQNPARSWETCKDYTPPNTGWSCDCYVEPKKTEEEKKVLDISNAVKVHFSRRCIEFLFPTEYQALEWWRKALMVFGVTLTFKLTIKGYCTKIKQFVNASECGCPSCPCDRSECIGDPNCEETVILVELKDKNLNTDSSESIII